VILTALQAPQARVINPGPPTGLTATAGDGRVTLSWTAPGSDGGAGISGYLIYQGTSPGGESLVPINAAPVRATVCTVIGLANGTAYYFTVVAVNDARLQGSDSGEASATPVAATASASASTSASATAGAGTAGGLGAPGAPTGLTATAGDAQVSLTWTAPTSGGSPPASYEIYMGTSPGFSLGTPVGGTTGTSAMVTGLADGTTYYFVVTAFDAQGKASGASGEVSAEPAESAVLTSKQVPKQVIVSLAAIAIGATLGALALAGQWLRRRSLRSRSPAPPPAAPPAEARAVPEPGRPGPVSIHEIGIGETYTVRLEPLAAAVITTIEELTP